MTVPEIPATEPLPLDGVVTPDTDEEPLQDERRTANTTDDKQQIRRRNFFMFNPKFVPLSFPPRGYVFLLMGSDPINKMLTELSLAKLDI